MKHIENIQMEFRIVFEGNYIELVYIEINAVNHLFLAKKFLR